jgi:hypothetical protein
MHRIKPSEKYYNLLNKEPLDKITRVSFNLTKIMSSNPILSIEKLVSVVAHTENIWCTPRKGLEGM